MHFVEAELSPLNSDLDVTFVSSLHAQTPYVREPLQHIIIQKGARRKNDHQI